MFREACLPEHRVPPPAPLRPQPKKADCAPPRKARGHPLPIPQKTSLLGGHFCTPIGGHYWMLIDTLSPVHQSAPRPRFHASARQTGRADFPHPAFGRDHAFARGRLAVRFARRMSPYCPRRRSSGNRVQFPLSALCLRHSHRRSRAVACLSTDAYAGLTWPRMK